MTPRDWEWNHLENRLALLNCPLPSRWDDLYAYRHAHRMWVREGKWLLYNSDGHPWSIIDENPDLDSIYAGLSWNTRLGKWKKK